jgi:hypothetical protein
MELTVKKEFNTSMDVFINSIPNEGTRYSISILSTEINILNRIRILATLSVYVKFRSKIK